MAPETVEPILGTSNLRGPGTANAGPIFPLHLISQCLIYVSYGYSSFPKLQSCLGVGVENSGPKKAMRVENLEENMA